MGCGYLRRGMMPLPLAWPELPRGLLSAPFKGGVSLDMPAAPPHPWMLGSGEMAAVRSATSGRHCQIDGAGVSGRSVGSDHSAFVDATPSSLHKGHCFPVEIITHCVWLYHRFPLSLRDVEQMMAHRGVMPLIPRAWERCAPRLRKCQ